VIHNLDAGTLVTDIAKSPTSGAKPIAQLALIHNHVTAILFLMNGEVFQRCPAGRLRQDAGLARGLFEKFAMFFSLERDAVMGGNHLGD